MEIIRRSCGGLNGDPIQTFKGHESIVSSVVFSSDGQTILTGSGDNTAKLWGLNGDPIQTFKGHKDEVTSVVFSPDGQTILAGSADSTAKLWRNLRSEYTAGTLWNRVQKLTPEEQAKYRIDWEY